MDLKQLRENNAECIIGLIQSALWVIMLYMISYSEEKICSFELHSLENVLYLSGHFDS